MTGISVPYDAPEAPKCVCVGAHGEPVAQDHPGPSLRSPRFCPQPAHWSAPCGLMLLTQPGSLPVRWQVCPQGSGAGKSEVPVTGGLSEGSGSGAGRGGLADSRAPQYPRGR